MAAPPPHLVLTGDYAKDVASLTNALRAITQCLSGGIELGRNARASVLTLDFTGPVTSDLSIATKLTKAPIAVWPASFMKTKPTIEPASMPTSFTWRFDSGDIVIPWLTGLTGTDSYSLSLVVWES